MVFLIILFFRSFVKSFSEKRKSIFAKSAEYNVAIGRSERKGMKRSVSLWQLFGFAVTSLGGTLLHFLYGWSGNAVWTAPFSAVNESTWEHMKLLFFSMFPYALIQSRFFRDFPDFWCVKCKGILLGLGLIPTLFYTVNGVFGKTPDWINIAIFFAAAAIAYLYETRSLARQDASCRYPKAALGLLCLIAVLFAVWTFVPPQINLFRDPLTGGFGRNS